MRTIKWFEIRVVTSREASDAVSEMLMSLGAGGVAIEDPHDIAEDIAKGPDCVYDGLFPSRGDDTVIKAYFGEDNDPTFLADRIREGLQEIGLFLNPGKGTVSYSEVDEEDWACGWKKYYKPFPISGRVVIKPTWEEYEKKGGEIVVELDPGMAFGTGTHETTKLCARLIEEYLKAGDRVIDIGCGSGILAIIASKLGAGRVAAVDIDETAVKAARENCRINGAGNVRVYKGTLNDIPAEEKADLAVANIIADVIIDLGPSLPRYLRAGGLFIASGIIRERKQEVAEYYRSIGFDLLKETGMNEWEALAFKWGGSL